MSRAERLETMTPELIADVFMYPAGCGGRRVPAPPGWGCACFLSKQAPLLGRDGLPLLGREPLEPGSRRRLGFVFLSPDTADLFRAAGTFYLWESGFIGEARVVAPDCD